MSAREDAERLLATRIQQLGRGYFEAQNSARQLLDAYRYQVLREAAAKIRAAADEIAGADDPRYGGVNEAADLIDPDQEQQ